MTVKEASEVQAQATSRRERSPAYPYTSLATAVERVRAMHRAEGRNPARLAVVAAHWGMSPTSSAPKQTAAALSAFGLAEHKGGSLKLTDRALRIILDEDPNSPARKTALEKAALEPRIHMKLWEAYGPDLPSDVNLRSTLSLEYKFNPNAVNGFIKQYKDTIRFAGLLDAGTLPVDSADKGEPEGQRMEIVQQQQRKDNPPPPATGLDPGRVVPPGSKQEIFTLDEGQVVLHWPASLSEASFEDFKGWLELIVRKAARVAGVQPDKAKLQDLNRKPST